MSGFLTRLVERARGTTPSARPLIAPSFSPAPELRADRPPLVISNESAETEDAHASTRRSAPQHRSPSTTDSLLLEEDARQPGRDEDVDNLTRAPRQTLPTPQTIPTSAERTASRHAESEASASSDRASTERRESQPTNVRVTEIDLLMPRSDPATTPSPARQTQPHARPTRDIQAHEAAATRTLPSHSQPAPADHVTSERANANETSPRQSEQSGGPVASTKSDAPRVIQVSTVRREVISSSNESSQAREPVVESPPTVHVSIGRVEVRAVAPQRPAEPRVETRPAPRMSLDEYLRAQSGRRG